MSSTNGLSSNQSHLYCHSAEGRQRAFGGVYHKWWSCYSPVILLSASGQTWRWERDTFSCTYHNTTFQASSDLPRIYLTSHFPGQVSTAMSQNKPRDNYFSSISFLHRQDPFSLLFCWKPIVTQNFSKRNGLKGQWTSNWYQKLYLLGLKHIAHAKAIWGTTFLTLPPISLDHALWLPLPSVLFFGGVLAAPSQDGRGWEVNLPAMTVAWCGNSVCRKKKAYVTR